MSRSSVWTAIAAILVVTACTDSEMPLDAVRHSQIPQQPFSIDTYRFIDDYFAAVDKAIPGFGGWYFDENGDVHVRLKNLGDSTAARVLIERDVRAHRAFVRTAKGPAAIFRFDAGDYSFTQLNDWHHKAMWFNYKTVVFTDADEKNNRIRIGVTSPAEMESIKAEAARVDVPVAAVLFVQHPGFTPHADGDSLTSRMRPVPGGVRTHVEKHDFTLGLCTLGANAIWRGMRVFLSNSHCTGVIGVVHGRRVFQNDFLYDSIAIATEISDPALIEPGAVYECNVSSPDKCRYSDVALFQYINSTTAEPAKIARTMTWSAFRGDTATRQINLADPRLTITLAVGKASAGEHIDKMGASSGWTYGDVYSTCVKGRNGNVVFICQQMVHYGAKVGDSGAPVFRNPSGGAYAYLHGIHWGGNKINGVWESIFSPLYNIDVDFGNPINASEFDFLR